MRFTEEMGRITLGRNADYALPALGFAGTPTGIDVRRVVESGTQPVINTGIAHRLPGVGQIGAGIARAPLACFAAGLHGVAERLGADGVAWSGTAVIAIGGNALIAEGQRARSPSSSAMRAPRRVKSRRWSRLAGASCHPRQRAAGRIHPAALGDVQRLAFHPRADAGHVRRRLRRGDRLYRRQQPVQRARPARPGIGTVCMLTQTVVDADDPAFHVRQNRSARRFRLKRPSRDASGTAGPWSRKPGAGIGAWCPSPKPVRIVETEAIAAARRGIRRRGRGWRRHSGGRGRAGRLSRRRGGDRQRSGVGVSWRRACGVPLLGDLDRCRARGGALTGSPISGNWIASVWPRCAGYLADGEFPEGSMGPKIRAAIEFLEHGGEEVVITSLACLSAAVNGRAPAPTLPDRERRPDACRV